MPKLTSNLGILLTQLGIFKLRKHPQTGMVIPATEERRQEDHKIVASLHNLARAGMHLCGPVPNMEKTKQIKTMKTVVMRNQNADIFNSIPYWEECHLVQEE